jgi:hypothetical protein
LALARIGPPFADEVGSVLSLSGRQEKKAAAKAAERAARRAQKNVLGFSSSASDSDDSADASRRRRSRKAATQKGPSAVPVAKPAWLVEVERRDREVMEVEYAKRGEARAWDAGKVDVVEQLARESMTATTRSGSGGGGGHQSALLRSARGGSYDY